MVSKTNAIGVIPVPLAGGTMTGSLILNANPTDVLGAVTKQYVDAISAGLTFKASCVAGTTANLTATYANGASGVGATLTNLGVMAAFSTDGVTPSVNARILVKDQSTTYENGIYTLTTVGSGITNWVLTRATDYDTPGEVMVGTGVIVTSGSTLANTIWLETATVSTIGTDPIVFGQFGNAGTVTSVTGTANRITSTGGATPVIDISASYVGQSSITTLGTITSGTWNGTGLTVPYGGTGLATFTTAYGTVCAGTTATGALQTVSPGTSGKVLISGGSSALPAYGTAGVTGGGTGVATMTTAYAPVCAGTTATGALQVADTGISNSGYVLTSNGPSALPSFQASSGGTVTSVSGTLNRITSTGGTTPVIDISASYVGQSSLTTLGTVTTGVWNATGLTVPYGGTGVATMTTAYAPVCAGTTATGALQVASTGLATAGFVLTSNGPSALPSFQAAASGTVTSVSGTSNRITSTGGTTPVIDISASYVGQSSITTLGTITTGVWTGTAITVPNGGTGLATMTTAYAPVCAGTTATGNLQVASTGLSTSGFVLTSTGASSLPTFQAIPAAASGLVFIASATASSSSVINFSNNLTSTYDNYLVLIENLVPATSTAVPTAQVGTGATPTYQTTTYVGSIFSFWNGGSPAATASSTSNHTFAESNGLTSTSTNAAQFTINFSNVNNASNRKPLTAIGHYINTAAPSAAACTVYSGVWQTATVLTSIRFQMSSGNIATGVFKLYGYQNS